MVALAETTLRPGSRRHFARGGLEDLRAASGSWNPLPVSSLFLLRTACGMDPGSPVSMNKTRTLPSHLLVDRCSPEFERSADAFGIKIAGSGTTPNQILYSGEYLDPGTGNYDLRAREYNQATGTFLTMDTTPGQLPYVYTSDNPVMLVDPSGHFGMADVLTSFSINFALTAGFDFVGNTYGADESVFKILAESTVGGLLGVIGGPEIAGKCADTVFPDLVRFLPDMGRMEDLAKVVLPGFSLGVFRSVRNTTALCIVYFFEHPNHPLTVDQTIGLSVSDAFVSGTLGGLESSKLGPAIRNALAKVGSNPTGALGELEYLGLAVPQALAKVDINGVAGDAILAFLGQFAQFLSEQAAVGH